MAIFYGYGGDDTVLYNGGNDYFDGGSGHDTLTGFGLRREYGNISLGGGNATVGGATAGAVETFQFTDGRFVTEVNDVEAQVFRLYGATLGRSPDTIGLKNWADAIRGNSLTLFNAVDGFTSSAEFQMRYGALDDVSFVRQIYRNVLDRRRAEWC
jgi:serralysin